MPTPTNARRAGIDALPLREWRRRRGYSQRNLAQAAGLSAKTIWTVENNPEVRHSLLPTTWRKLANALAIEITSITEFWNRE